MNTPVTLDSEAKKTTIILGKFPGALGGFQRSAYNDCRLAGIPSEVAHKIAGDFGSDMGSALRNAGDDGLKAAIAKASKAKGNEDGKSRIKLSGGGKTTTSRTMSIIRLCQQLDGLCDEGLIKSRKLNPDTLTDNLREYYDDCVTWAESNEFTTEKE